MRILITNHALDDRAGTELYTHDLALGLRSAGHAPVVYSPRLGGVAQAVRAASIPVVDDLRRVAEAPDVIHGHHQLTTAAALCHFPDTPAVFVCHGWSPWQEAPPRLSGIHWYVAVDELCRERLVSENGVPPERVELIENFVDLERFRPRDPLPARPARALVYSNYVTALLAEPVRAACAATGLALDVVGLRAGNPSEEPERLLAGYDLVFAKGRAALEALAVGAAVVLFDAEGLGPLVTSAGLGALRRRNFGRKTLGERPTPQAIGERIAGYDAGDAARVSEAVRSDAGLERGVARLTELYRRVIAEHGTAGDRSPEHDLRELASYLASLSEPLGDLYALRKARHLWERERTGWLGERESLIEDLQGHRAAHAAHRAEAAAAAVRLEGLAAEAAALRDGNRRLEGDLATVTGSLTWRARAGLLGLPLIARAYRWLAGL